VKSTGKWLARLFLVTHAFAGCYSAPPPSPPGSLAEVKVPPKADLSGVRGVSVTINGAPTEGRLDLLRPDGGVVFTGRIRSGQTISARVAIPTKDSTIIAVLRVADLPERRLSLAIKANVAAGSFQ
jgi:hypothetical protein